MKVCFDTSVLVAALVDEHPQHERALACFVAGLNEGIERCCTTHSLAECYSTLTSLPLRHRIQPSEARQLIEANLADGLSILEIPGSAYMESIASVADLGLRSGIIYDALHLASAEAAGCDRFYTFNLKDFERLKPTSVDVISP